MALETISKQFGSGLTKVTDQGKGGLKAILTELQGVTLTGAAGVGAGSNITIAAMTAEDTVLAVVDITTPAAPTVLNASDFVCQAGTLKSNLATSAKGLLILWANKK